MLRQKLISITFTVLLAVSWPADSAVRESAALRKEATRLEHGLDVDRNYANAYALYCIATLQGDTEAAYHLGWMHLNGRGMPSNSAVAIGWFRLAAERGDPHSQRLLDDLLRNGHAEEDSNCSLNRKRPRP